MDPLCASLLPNNTTHWLAFHMWCLVRMLWIMWLAFLSLCACVTHVVLYVFWFMYVERQIRTLHVCVCMHTQHVTCIYRKCRQHSVQVVCVFSPLHSYSKRHTVSCCTHTHMQPNSTLPQHSVHLYKLLAVSCIDHVPPNPQDGRTPLMLAAGAGHLPVARLLVETYHCDVNEEDGEVSGWEVMGSLVPRPISAPCKRSH